MRSSSPWLSIAPVLLLVVTHHAFGADVLRAAQDLGSDTYKDYEYGSTGHKKVDCVQFVLAVVEKVAADEKQTDKITKDTKKTIQIQLNKEDKENLQQLVDDGDARTTGVQKALVDAGLGKKVKAEDAKAGDFVQYWYKDGGVWKGHSGVIEKISNGKATIYGAHKTTLQADMKIKNKGDRKGGVGSGPVFDLTDTSRKVYVVRWTVLEE